MKSCWANINRRFYLVTIVKLKTVKLWTARLGVMIWVSQCLLLVELCHNILDVCHFGLQSYFISSSNRLVLSLHYFWAVHAHWLSSQVLLQEKATTPFSAPRLGAHLGFSSQATVVVGKVEEKYWASGMICQRLHAPRRRRQEEQKLLQYYQAWSISTCGVEREIGLLQRRRVDRWALVEGGRHSTWFGIEVEEEL